VGLGSVPDTGNDLMKPTAWIFLLSLPLLGGASAGADDGIESLRETGKAFASVARAVSPSVVNIQTEVSTPGGQAGAAPLPFGDLLPFGDELFRRFFGERLPSAPRPEAPPRERRTLGQGSGFVFASKDGQLAAKTYILTNNHVVDGAERIRVRLQDGRELDAAVTGRDPQSDVAVIEIPTGGVPPLELADSARLEIGEWVIAIGNPFGLRHTVTVGVVSAKGRTTLGINDYEDFIQTDAAINPGNSGGPLVNLDGEVVGMNTAIFSRTGGYMGVGFAIPSKLVGAVAEQLIESGQVTRGYLGITIQQITQELAEPFGLDRVQGVLVAEVAGGSPAAAAGLRQGDVILAYRGEAAQNVGAFRNRVALTPPGSGVELTVLRNGERLAVAAVIGTLTGDEPAATGVSGARDADALGLTVQPVTPELARQLDAAPGEGVVVTQVEPGSVAATAGLEPGTIILHVNREPVRDPAELERAVERATGKRVLLLVRKGGMQQFLVLSW
jgi:serine protease Do